MFKHHASRDLEAEHQPDRIRARLEADRSSSYLGDAVLGGIDGCVMTGMAFFGIGSIKGHWLGTSRWRGGFRTLLVGGVAAVLAYMVGAWLRSTFGVV